MWGAFVRRLLRLFGRGSPADESLGEDECYERSYGGRTGEVTVMPVTKRPRLLPRLSGEQLRRCFEERLNSRRAAGVLEDLAERHAAGPR